MQQEPKPGYDAALGVDVAAGSRSASATVGAFPSVDNEDTGFWLTYKDQRIRFERSEDGQSWSVPGSLESVSKR